MHHHRIGSLDGYHRTSTVTTDGGPWFANVMSRIFPGSQVIPMHNDNTWGRGEKNVWNASHSRSTNAPFFDFKRYLSRYWPSSSPLPLISNPRQNSISRLRESPTPLTMRLPAASTVRFVLLCGLWYFTSALSSNTGKAIMTQFRYPVTLTFVQFGFVALYCMLIMAPPVGFSKMRRPTKAIVRSTLPMGLFQVGGHIFSSMAISRIPVSTVHTIKALSPLFTVVAYALLFRVSYSARTYLSLLPLTIGVMLACTFDMSASNTAGLLCAFGSAVVFVTSNIFFKKIMPSPSASSSSIPAHKLDKINLLFYSSGMAFLLMIPIWLYYDLPVFLPSSSAHIAHPSHGHSTPHSVAYYFFMNGTVHFLQNIIAFVILSTTSPVTYSIASLIKRVAVICIAIMWFNQTLHPVQGFGIGMTFFGLWMYNNAKGDVEKGEKKMRRVEAEREMMLPSTKAEVRMMNGTETPPEETGQVPVSAETTGTGGVSSAYGRPRGMTLTNFHPPPPGGHLHHSTPPLQSHAPSSHSHPTLHIKITAPIPAKSLPITQHDASRIDSYPSPPPSLDSPPGSGAAIHGYIIGGKFGSDTIIPVTS